MSTENAGNAPSARRGPCLAGHGRSSPERLGERRARLERGTAAAARAPLLTPTLAAPATAWKRLWRAKGNGRDAFFLNLNSPGKRAPAAKAALQVRGAVSRRGIIDVPVSSEQHRLFSREPQETLELEKAGNHHKQSSGRHGARGSRLFLLLSTKNHKAEAKLSTRSDPSAERGEHPAEG